MFGRPYKDKLDHVIVDILFSEGSHGYKDLKRNVEQYLQSQHSISDNTFSHHLKRMEYGKVIRKIGKTYSLTDESKNIMLKERLIDTKKYRYWNRPIDTSPYQ